ncbi:MAG TPA: hypothetical protein VFB96_09655 [Pirellulaceae bacterium]|nr:hypothetical protein [Pirellulaceae bacterium]
MKGPYERLKYDLRRLWECPQCRRRERTDGAVTFRQCACQSKTDGGQPIAMLLLEESGHRTVPPIVPKINDEPPTVTANAEPLSKTDDSFSEPPAVEPAASDAGQPPDDSSSSLPPG